MNKSKAPTDSGSGKPAEVKSRNAVATRVTILEAARTRFIQDGYDNAGLRAIAADAGIDAALICRYFGSKKQLFAEVLESTREESANVFIGERSSCGRRLADKILGSAKSAKHMTFIGLVTSSSSSAEASSLVHRHIAKYFIKPFAEWLGGPKANETAWLMVAMLMGVVIMNTIKSEKQKSVDRLAEILQGIIDSA